MPLAWPQYDWTIICGRHVRCAIAPTGPHPMSLKRSSMGSSINCISEKF